MESKWLRYVPHNINRSNAAAISSAIPLPVTSTTAAYVSPAQKDDDAALISWNRKPCDVAKYPLLKNDADYQDWKLKMKRQLLADTLSRVTDPTFRLTTGRTGADMELATLQINFFEQILSAVLLNPESKRFNHYPSRGCTIPLESARSPSARFRLCSNQHNKQL
jgi:hypothetical protein